MGWYGGRPLQSLYSGLKVPLLLACAMVVVLPNFFVINTILGLRDDLQAALRGVLAAQGTLAVCLASLAPITALGYVTALIAKLILPVLAIYWGVRDLNGGRYSPGKLLGQFRVVDITSGQIADTKQCLLRNSYYVLLIILAALPFWDFFNMFLVTLVMCIDLLVMIASPTNRRIGDLIAKTQVVPIK